jgi:fimbrial chaperone protein
LRKTLLLFLFIAACAISAQAFSFEPISQDFAPSGQSANHVFRVHNTTAERIAVQVSVRPRRIEPNGTEIQGKEAEEFVVYPRQMLLEPDEQRSVRVRWNGPADIPAELPFRIIAEQLPVDFGEDHPAEGASIRLTYRYEGALYVVPSNAAPDIRVDSVAIQPGEDGMDMVVQLRNDGTRHALLKDLVLHLRETEDGERRITLETAELPGIAGENMLAGSIRRFRTPVPAEMWDGPIYVDMEYSPE